ncbi:LysE family translocator [Undibacterium sp. CY18W]|uniref:LysE family translocator n=1 Tax=Undibacterium hunanense TaxID=2762292 RepID=A0ABR6ZSA5_9BURK|nr:LysE family translocator [Undibacterium hunanense]MBC3918778.1 LysE family translocator [Undibacterium hunanense]
MQTQTLLAFTAIASLAVLSPGPAILLSLKNGASYGARAVMWSAFGNVCGIFCLSTTAFLGMGALLNSSALLFAAVKIIGALYLFYIGIKQLFGKSNAFTHEVKDVSSVTTPRPRKLFFEAFLTAATNPKALMFFTALFPHFITPGEALAPQFFALMAIFMSLSYLAHLMYAQLAARAMHILVKPRFAKWINRVVGAAFISFGAMLLSLRRQTA